MDYRKEIDGLRALAIIPVVLFHSGLPLFSWGYIGVDIFFVISGFLITSIIYPKIQSKSFKFSWFYENRIRRLFPALFMMVATTSMFSLIFLDPIKLKEFSYSIFSSIFFYSNFFFWKEIDYFETNSELMPLLHTWSLSIEEQFYIVFPILLIYLIRVIPKSTLTIIISLCFLSFLIWVYGTMFSPTATFYLPITRAWELLAGASLAIYISQSSFFNKRYISSIGMLVIFLSFFLFSLDINSKNLLMFLPVIGTLMILATRNHNTFVEFLLKNKVSIFFGLISYSLYLYHQPIFAFAKVYFIDLELKHILTFIILSILISYISWRYLEQLFRKRFNSEFSLSKTIQIILFPLLISLSISVYSISTNGNKDNYLANLAPDYFDTFTLLETIKAENEEDLYFNNNECLINVNSFSSDLEAKIIECHAKHGKGILIFGDSHAKDFFNSYLNIRSNNFIIGITANFCQAHTTIEHCYYRELAVFLRMHPNLFQDVYFHQAGYFFLKHLGSEFNNKDFFDSLKLADNDKKIDISHSRIENLKSNLEKIFDDFIVIGPRFEPHIQNKYIEKFSCNYQFSPRTNLSDAFKLLDKSFAETFNSKNYVSLQKLLDFSMEKDFMNCNNLFWSDGDHWSSAGEKYFSERLGQLTIKDVN